MFDAVGGEAGGAGVVVGDGGDGGFEGEAFFAVFVHGSFRRQVNLFIINLDIDILNTLLVLRTSSRPTPHTIPSHSHITISHDQLGKILLCAVIRQRISVQVTGTLCEFFALFAGTGFLLTVETFKDVLEVVWTVLHEFEVKLIMTFKFFLSFLNFGLEFFVFFAVLVFTGQAFLFGKSRRMDPQI